MLHIRKAKPLVGFRHNRVEAFVGQMQLAEEVR